MKGIGYLMSTISLGLLAAVSWRTASQDPQLKWLLIAGVVTSFLGMLIRYLSHVRDHRMDGGNKREAWWAR